MNLFWLIRATRWARNPPSSARVKLVLAVIAICLLLFAIERGWGWPAFLKVDTTLHRGAFR
jgi:predicted acyltransferase